MSFFALSLHILCKQILCTVAADIQNWNINVSILAIFGSVRVSRSLGQGHTSEKALLLPGHQLKVTVSYECSNITLHLKKETLKNEWTKLKKCLNDKYESTSFPYLTPVRFFGNLCLFKVSSVVKNAFQTE